MSAAAALFIGAMFSLPAGIICYFVLAAPDQPWCDMRYLLAVVLLFCIPLFGYPEAAGTAVLFFGAGLVLTGYIRRWTHQQETRPPEPEPEPEPQHGPETTPDPTPTPEPREAPLTDAKGRPVIFEDQLEDSQMRTSRNR